jgi:hypothetical protein
VSSDTSRKRGSAIPEQRLACIEVVPVFGMPICRMIRRMRKGLFCEVAMTPFPAWGQGTGVREHG